MLDMSPEARRRRKNQAYEKLDRDTAGPLAGWAFMAYLAQAYQHDIDDYHDTTGQCPNCGNPMPTNTCSCGCEHKDDGDWVMRHYDVRCGESVCDNETSLWRWLEPDPMSLLCHQPAPM